MLGHKSAAAAGVQDTVLVEDAALLAVLVDAICCIVLVLVMNAFGNFFLSGLPLVDADDLHPYSHNGSAGHATVCERLSLRGCEL